jgi:hypothetical protein
MLTAAEIRSKFPAWVPVILSDSDYGKPTVAWLREKFWPWFQRQRFDLGLLKWDRRNDCDNFARSYAQSAADCHALTVGENAEGLAVGEFYYIGTSHVKGAHAIVVAFTEEGKIYIEPQTGQRLALTPTEELSCFFVRF